MIECVVPCGNDSTGAWARSPGGLRIRNVALVMDGREMVEGDDLVSVLFNSVLSWSGNWDRAEPAGRWDQ